MVIEVKFLSIAIIVGIAYKRLTVIFFPRYLRGMENVTEQKIDREDDVESIKNVILSSRDETEEVGCSLYISRIIGLKGVGELSRSNLEEVIEGIEPKGHWHVSKTSCGLIATFASQNDAEKLLQRRDLACVFEGPVQMARFASKNMKYRQAVLLRDVPWAIPLQDLSYALKKQKVTAGNVERSRQYVRVEILDPAHYEYLLRQGLDFFGVTRFNAIPERSWRNPDYDNPRQRHLGSGIDGTTLENTNTQQEEDNVLQCYRCQGFWHVAANCRHLPRCVRCGEAHNVEFCPRPRNNPVCCHCSGAHHAGYRRCPVRLQLVNATPIGITLSASKSDAQRL